MDVGTYIEGNIYIHATVVGIGTLHILHARCTINLFFYWDCHCLFYSLCIGTRILTIYRNRRGANVGILIYCKVI